MTEGRVEGGFELVADAFAASLEGSAGGAAFAAFVDGEPVVDLWGGERDPLTHSEWEQDTIALLFSGTKGLVATCIALLLERGLLQLDTPVAEYWPEFAAHGKEGVLVRHVLAHTAGVPGLRSSFTTDDLLGFAPMAERVAAEPPFWPPGERLAYHALTFGWICGELVLRVDGRSVGRFVADELVRPLGLDVWIGLPAELEPRVAKLMPRSDYGITHLGDGPEPLLGAVYGDALTTFRWNDPRLHRVELPGANGIGDARSMARLYGSLDRLLAPETVVLVRQELSRERCAITLRPYAYGAGFELQTELARFGPAVDGFGHTGSGGSVHGAWPSRRVGFSYVMSELRPEAVDGRSARILAALDRCL